MSVYTIISKEMFVVLLFMIFNLVVVLVMMVGLLLVVGEVLGGGVVGLGMLFG